jgi:hypothetical protein
MLALLTPILLCWLQSTLLALTNVCQKRWPYLCSITHIWKQYEIMAMTDIFTEPILAVAIYQWWNVFFLITLFRLCTTSMSGYLFPQKLINSTFFLLIGQYLWRHWKYNSRLLHQQDIKDAQVNQGFPISSSLVAAYGCLRANGQLWRSTPL